MLLQSKIAYNVRIRMPVEKIKKLCKQSHLTLCTTAALEWSDLCDSGGATHKLSHGKAVQHTQCAMLLQLVMAKACYTKFGNDHIYVPKNNARIIADSNLTLLTNPFGKPSYIVNMM